jgi:hypothetical protein
MAVILYGSGVLEEYKSSGLVFTDEEILHVFKEEEIIKTKRLYQIPNTWCVWGENIPISDDTYNRLGSEVIESYVYSHILFLHDSELNPEWKLTDDMIQNDYNKFRIDLHNFIDSVALEIVNIDKQANNNVNSPENIIVLNTIGPTNDKRMIFEFNPKKQTDIFYSDNVFKPFADRVYAYLDKNFKTEKPFTIFENQNMVIVIGEENADYFIDQLIDTFIKSESYEICKNLRDIKKTWHEKNGGLKKKRGRPKKIKTSI